MHAIIVIIIIQRYQKVKTAFESITRFFRWTWHLKQRRERGNWDQPGIRLNLFFWMGSLLITIKSRILFWGSSKNWINPQTKPPQENLTKLILSNLWNAQWYWVELLRSKFKRSAEKLSFMLSQYNLANVKFRHRAQSSIST